ncbi:hypothetical protein CDAR_479081 [Caerostris darwini]|uniref:Secreted protein n=1 Tax=Caerostris darwini TaxID=1538125 RepID=A0AAV4VII0_9ARAC|nr:hypothetical protein CDAR_479081 [Caerostris darwini]
MRSFSCTSVTKSRFRLGLRTATALTALILRWRWAETCMIYGEIFSASQDQWQCKHGHKSRQISACVAPLLKMQKRRGQVCSGTHTEKKRRPLSLSIVKLGALLTDFGKTTCASMHSD